MSPFEDPKILKGIIENGPDAIILMGLDGVFLGVNQATEAMLGLPRTSLLGRSIEEIGFLSETDLVRAQDILASASDGKSVGPEIFPVRRHGGDMLVSQIRGQPTHLDGRPLMIVIARDVTEQTAMERRSLLLSTAISQAAEAVVVTTVQGIIVYVNPAFEMISGYSSNEVLGRNPNFMKSGEQTPEFYQNMWNTILAGRVWEGRMINRRKDGRLYEEESTISPVLSESGVVDHFVAVKRDISRLMDLERQLQQSQKMESLGVLAGGIAHDFNNILTPILGHAQLAQKSLPENPRERERMKQIIAASLRAKDLVRQILTFSRRSEMKMTPVELAPLVKESLKFIQHGIPANVQIQSRIGPGCGAIKGDSTQIHQVMHNLMANAAHSMTPRGGVIEVSLESVTVEKDPPDLSRGRYLRLRIKDTGSGMTPDTLSRVFEPFFSTKQPGNGTGLGLSVVHGIVVLHGGHIHFDSRIGEGTEVEVLLPEIRVKQRSTPPALEITPGSGRILVVDDQKGVLLVLSEMLGELGYTVATFESGLEALDFVRAHPGEAELLITDEAMPGMVGSDLVRKAAEVDPGLPAVLMTGHQGLIPEPEAGRKGLPVLMKPFEIGTLSRIVARHARTQAVTKAA